MLSLLLIKPKEKIGVVGRTSARKTSLTMAHKDPMIKTRIQEEI